MVPCLSSNGPMSHQLSHQMSPLNIIKYIPCTLQCLDVFLKSKTQNRWGEKNDWGGKKSFGGNTNILSKWNHLSDRQTKYFVPDKICVGGNTNIVCGKIVRWKHKCFVWQNGITCLIVCMSCRFFRKKNQNRWGGKIIFFFVKRECMPWNKACTPFWQKKYYFGLVWVCVGLCSSSHWALLRVL